MPTVSVVIPCFNQGYFLNEAVDSVLRQTWSDFEIIVVNDGSTDQWTNELLAQYRKEKTKVITTANQGLAAARNNGIRQASGKYILPLDADDRIGSTYLEKAVQILENKPDIGIVYCQARLFGAVETEWNLPAYSLPEMLQDNVIFCTALFRRTDWEMAGGYDPGMIYGWEDYDFWLSLIENDRQVYQIPEQLFYYRVASDSMVRSKEKWQKVAMFKRVFDRHQKLFLANIDIWIDRLLTLREPYYTSRLYIDSGSGISDAASIGRKIEKGTTVITFRTEDYDGIQALRFDPVDTYTVMEIGKVVLENDAGLVEILGENLLSNSCFREHNLLYFDTPDPQIFFECDSLVFAKLNTLTVTLHFIALGEEALVLVMAKLQKQLDNLKQENAKIREKSFAKTVLQLFKKPHASH